MTGTQTTRAIITDPAEVIGDLDALWATGGPRAYGDKRPVPLQGSEWDQVTVGHNPYWDIVRRLPLERGLASEIAVDGYALRPGSHAYVAGRGPLCKTFAWAIPAPNDIAWISDLLAGRGVVEVGAGTGYWAWQLTQSGVDVLAYDIEPGGNRYCGPVQYHPVLKGGPDVAAVYDDRALFLCWPPYDEPVAADAVKAFGGDLLIYVGEGGGGCTGDDEFFDLLERDWVDLGESPGHVMYGGIHCRLAAYRREVVSSIDEDSGLPVVTPRVVGGVL